MAAASSFLVAIAAVCVYLAWQGFQDGQYTRIKYLLGIVVFLAIATRFRTVYQPQRNGNLESEQGTIRDLSSVTIRNSKAPILTLCSLMGWAGTLLALAAYDLLASDDSPGYAGTVVFAAAALFFWSMPLAYLTGHLSSGYIAFTADGVHQRGWATESFIPWTSVAGAKAAYNGFPMTLVIGVPKAPWERRYTTRFWRIDRIYPLPFPLIEIDYRKIGDDAALVHAFVMEQVQRQARGLAR